MTYQCHEFLSGKTDVVYTTSEMVIEQEIVPIVWPVARRKDFPVIDIFSVTKGHPEYSGDGVHPNAIGNNTLARTLITRL